MKGLGTLFLFWGGLCILCIILGFMDANNQSNLFAVILNNHFIGVCLNAIIGIILGISFRSYKKSKEPQNIQNALPFNIQPGAMFYDPNTQQYYVLQPVQPNAQQMANIQQGQQSLNNPNTQQ